MTSTPKIDTALREAILARPQDILDDRDMMQALIAINEKRMGDNIVDLRGMAMERLEARLDRLEDTHRSVIAAAYDNVAGTNQIHRAVLRLLDAEDLGPFLVALKDDVAETLRVDAIRLILEVTGEQLIADDGQGVLIVARSGFIDDYIGMGGNRRGPDITLRMAPPSALQVYGEATGKIGSEACIRLDLGLPGVSGMMALGTRDPGMFSPQQGSDLLRFFGSVVSRLLARGLM